MMASSMVPPLPVEGVIWSIPRLTAEKVLWREVHAGGRSRAERGQPHGRYRRLVRHDVDKGRERIPHLADEGHGRLAVVDEQGNRGGRGGGHHAHHFADDPVLAHREVRDGEGRPRTLLRPSTETATVR